MSPGFLARGETQRTRSFPFIRQARQLVVRQNRQLGILGRSAHNVVRQLGNESVNSL
jgi:hypothetical protein